MNKREELIKLINRLGRSMDYGLGALRDLDEEFPFETIFQKGEDPFAEALHNTEILILFLSQDRFDDFDERLEYITSGATTRHLK